MLLLDTQVLLWLLDGNPRLGADARGSIASASVVHASAASVWELTIKAMLGKLRIPDDLVARLEAQGLSSLAISAEHAAAVGDFPELLRHDPFDRLLVAQAHHDGLQLLTADRVLLDQAYPFVTDATR